MPETKQTKAVYFKELTNQAAIVTSRWGHFCNLAMMHYIQLTKLAFLDVFPLYNKGQPFIYRANKQVFTHVVSTISLSAKICF